MTQLRFLALIWIVWASASWAQSDTDPIEAATLTVIERLYEAGESQFRAALIDQGHTQAEVDAILSAAFDELATCLVAAARAQAREQGLSEPLILKSISDMVSDEESKRLVDLDTNALHIKERTCNDVFDKRIATGKRQ